LKSATAHIDRIMPLCNAACLMKGLHRTHGFRHIDDKRPSAIELGQKKLD
jgi:hypothetical protein